MINYIILFISLSLIIIMVMINYKILYLYKKLNEALKEFNNEDNLDKLKSENWEKWPLLQAALIKMEKKLKTYSISAIRKKQAEYLALQNQINPHFLYNTLEAIRSDAICEGMYNIANTTKALAIFFRYTITEVGYFVTLEDELENVENYFTIQQYRFGDKLDMKVCFPEDNSGLLQLQMPKLTLQPIVENAISHGLECKVGIGVVEIIIEHTNETLLICIKDDGVGMEEKKVQQLNEIFSKQAKSFGKEEHPQKGGIALINVNNRIQLLFGEDYGIHIYSVIGVGTQVNIRLPKIRKKFKNKR